MRHPYEPLHYRVRGVLRLSEGTQQDRRLFRSEAWRHPLWALRGVSLYEVEVLTGKAKGQVVHLIAQRDPGISVGDVVRPMSSWWGSFISTSGPPVPHSHVLSRLELSSSDESGGPQG